MKTFFISFVISFFIIFSSANISFSQYLGNSSNVLDEVKPVLKPWGRIKYLVIGANDNIGITDPGSRVGLNVKQFISPSVSIFGGVELSVTLSSNGDFSLSPDNSGSTGFLNIIDNPSNSVFRLRKGFVGADFGKYGSVSLGKQYGAYYEVAGSTDISENNSGYASYVFSPEGTDGGYTGTGRASNSILYKNSLKNLKFALSAQFKLSERKFNTLVNSISSSVIYTLPLNLNFGVTFNSVFLDPGVGSRIRGLNGNPFYSAVCLNYSNSNLFLGFTYAYQQNGDIAYIKDSSVIYSGYGIEIAAKYNPYKKWSILAGINYKHPYNIDELVNKNFNRLVYFYGLQFLALSNLEFFFEGAIDRSVSPIGERLSSNISTGIKFDF